MSDDQRLAFHWTLWISLGWRYTGANYHSSDFEQVLSRYYVADGEGR